MKSLAEHMSMYAAYHRNPTNRAIHFVFVPAIVWTIMIALDLAYFGTMGGVNWTWAFVITGFLLLWYLSLDFALGVAAVALFTMLLVGAIQLNLAIADTRTSLLVAAAIFVASWIAQFVGHGVWEKRRPALADNILQVFVAPLFLISEVAFALGFKKDLHAEVQEKMKAHERV